MEAGRPMRVGSSYDWRIDEAEYDQRSVTCQWRLPLQWLHDTKQTA